MQKANEIRHHIGTVEETRKITNAMQLVATARAKKVIPKMEYNARFLQQVQSVMKDLLLSPHLEKHPYLHWSSHQRRTYIVVSGDKGMAGCYNSAVLGMAWNEIKKSVGQRADWRKDIHLITVGLMGEGYFRARGIVPDEQLGGVTQDPSLFNARQLALDVQERYDNKRTDQVFIIYTPYRNGAAAAPVVHRILPIRISDFLDVDSTERAHTIEYHPNEVQVFNELVPQFLVGYIFGALMHSYASEHTSRMTAMQSATRNADEMLEKLRLQHNLARQAAVTQEIAEISSSMFV
ncbi:MAG: ATP synthase F1 subunit gamma [Oscillospiraceae bacterium]|jgi:F-type H+-transporting ATPase subunit gamma|nr:ATP synthase F1 subunit gamma [Oscillospiraceae bacterium]